MNEVTGWIPVGERMPEPGTECIVWSPGNAQHGPYAFLDTWREQRECPVGFSTVSVPVGLGWDSSALDEITHWMPLPRAPSGMSTAYVTRGVEWARDQAIRYLLKIANNGTLADNERRGAAAVADELRSLRGAAELLCIRLRDLEADEMFTNHNCGETGCPVVGVREAAAELRAVLDGVDAPTTTGGQS